MTHSELQIALKNFRRLALMVAASVLIFGILPLVIGVYFSAGYRYSEQIEWIAMCWMVLGAPSVLAIGVYILQRNRIGCPLCGANLNNRVTQQSGKCWKCGHAFG